MGWRQPGSWPVAAARFVVREVWPPYSGGTWRGTLGRFLGNLAGGGVGVAVGVATESVVLGVTAFLALLFFVGGVRLQRSMDRLGRIRLAIPEPELAMRGFNPGGTQIFVRLRNLAVLVPPGSEANGSFEFAATLTFANGTRLETSTRAEQLRRENHPLFTSVMPNPVDAQGHRKRDLILVAKPPSTDPDSLRDAKVTLDITEHYSKTRAVLSAFPWDGTWDELVASQDES